MDGVVDIAMMRLFPQSFIDANPAIVAAISGFLAGQPPLVLIDG